SNCSCVSGSLGLSCCVGALAVLAGLPASALSPHAARPPMAATAVTVRAIFLIVLRILGFLPVAWDSVCCLSPGNRKGPTPQRRRAQSIGRAWCVPPCLSRCGGIRAVG